jgi:integrase
MYLSKRPNNTLAIRKAHETEADFVPHLRIEEVQELSLQAEKTARAGKGERDSLLIQTLFDGCFRVSEALRLTPESLVQTHHGWVARIRGKGNKVAEVAISSPLASTLLAHAYNKGIKREEWLFPVSSTRVWQIVDRAFEKAGIRKPDHVGTVHVLWHSGAIARLAATGNPKAVQDQLRHKEAKMTLRYLKTLSSLESLKIQQGVDFDW